MDKISSNSICAFCTSATDNKSVRFLESFNREFIINPLFQLNYDKSSHSAKSLPGNWSICGECLPQIQLLLGSKQKVDKVDSEVRYLQKRILSEMNRLLEEVDKMCGEMVMIEGVLRSHPTVPLTTPPGKPAKKKKRGRKSSKFTNEEAMILEFREKIFNVLKDLQIFRVETSSKLLQKDVPSKTPPVIPIRGPPQTVSSSKPLPCPSKPEHLPVPKINVEEVTEDDMDMDTTEDNYLDSPPTSPPSRSPPPPPPTDTVSSPTDIIDQGQPGKRKRKSVSLQKPAEYEGLDLTSSSDEDIPEDSQDFEFDPRQKIPVNLLKKIAKYSKFRKALITRVHEGSTIATSDILPPSKSDPRRPFCIRYTNKTNEFSLSDIPINCLDSEETLQCSQCDYSISSKKFKRENAHREIKIEDWIFDHILSKHLNAYDCHICGKSCTTGNSFNEHLKFHDLAFVCDICQKPLSTKETLKNHRWTHLSEEERTNPNDSDWMPTEVKNWSELRFQCETCGKGFKKVGKLKEHEIIHKDPEERGKVMCTDCGKQVFPKYLKIHQSKFCEKVKGPPRGEDCKICGINVRTLRELHEHLKDKHPGERIWGCEVCGGNFKTKWHLRMHQQIHEEGFRFICERCGRGFKQNRNRKRHQDTCKGSGGKGQVKIEEMN